jgi:hypothetical protein
MYVERDTEARSCKYCCLTKAMSITCSECVFAALVIRHAMRRIILSYLDCITVAYFSHIISQTARFLVKCY